MTKPLHLHFDGIDDYIRADQNMPRQWPDEWKEDMKIYRQWYEGFGIPRFVRWLQKVLERGAEWWKRTKAK